MVNRFTLEAVMQRRPMAVISGKTYRLHDVIPAMNSDQVRFELVNVGHRSVTLEYEGRRFVLRMKLPGNQER